MLLVYCGNYFSISVAIIASLVSCILIYLDNRVLPNELEYKRIATEVVQNSIRMQAANNSCFVVGYTGEVGKELVKELLTRKVFSRVTLIGRREVQYSDELFKDVEQVKVDFDKLDEHADAFRDYDAGFCCLGTTRGKAGKEGFIKVDHDYVMRTAELAKSGGCSHFSVVSSAGVNKDSMFLYGKVKGQVEEELKQLKFPRLSIFKPAILLCDRVERRFGEQFIRTVLKPIFYLFPTAISIPTSTVAKAMVNAAISPKQSDIDIYENKAIHQMGADQK